jgi:hypothetical protein
LGCGSAVPVPSPVSPTESFAGTVLRYQDGAPVAGATVRYGTNEAVSGADGTFTLAGVDSGPVFLRSSAPGYLERETWIQIGEPGMPVRLEMIQDADPFSLLYYRQFARAAYDDPGGRLAELRPWQVSPSFYIKTTLEDVDDELPPELLPRLIELFEHSVPVLSGGRFRVSTVEVGSESRPQTAGWVNVWFYRHIEGALGRATIGGDSGHIRLTYDPEREQRSTGAPAPCGSLVLDIADHEIVHTMGFWHTDLDAVPPRPSFHSAYCDGASRPDYVRYHAAVAYSRPRGNLDEDRDPVIPVTALRPAGLTPAVGPVVSCFRY